MCGIRPVAGNVIAIGLAIVGLVFLMNGLNNHELKLLKIYLAYFIEVAAGVQILKSASRSIILPLIATIMGLLYRINQQGINCF